MFWLTIFSALFVSAWAHFDYEFWSCSSIPEQVEFCRAEIGRFNVHSPLNRGNDKKNHKMAGIMMNQFKFKLKKYMYF